MLKLRLALRGKGLWGGSRSWCPRWDLPGEGSLWEVWRTRLPLLGDVLLLVLTVRLQRHLGPWHWPRKWLLGRKWLVVGGLLARGRHRRRGLGKVLLLWRSGDTLGNSWLLHILRVGAHVGGRGRSVPG